LSSGSLRLTVHFGERGRSGGEALADRLMSAFEAGGLSSAVLLRGGEGFGPKHGLQSAGQLTLSEDLPMVAVALDSAEKIEAVAKEIHTFLNEGLMTVEPALRTGSDALVAPVTAGPSDRGAAGQRRLTVWSERQARIGGLPAHVGLVECLREHGAHAAIALLGVDGVTDGVRQKAGFFSANRRVPLLVVGVGSHDAIGDASASVCHLLPEAVQETVELRATDVYPVTEVPSAGAWRLTVHGGGTEPETGIRQQRQVIRLLRQNGASGATAYFGLYGFQGDEDPYGDSFRSLRRQIPVLTEVVDTPVNCQRWLREIEELTAGSALTTISLVEALSRPAGPV